MDDLDERAQKMRRAVLGPAHADRTAKNRTPFNADFQSLIARYAWGEVWSRPGLDMKTRSMLTIGMLVAMGRADELKLHIRATRNTGVTQDEVREILMHATIYAGVPAAFSAFQVASAVYAEMEAEDKKA
jgi:4-carboxymuconolactone decarboxylase